MFLVVVDEFDKEFRRNYEAYFKVSNKRKRTPEFGKFPVEDFRVYFIDEVTLLEMKKLPTYFLRSVKNKFLEGEYFLAVNCDLEDCEFVIIRGPEKDLRCGICKDMYELTHVYTGTARMLMDFYGIDMEELFARMNKAERKKFMTDFIVNWFQTIGLDMIIDTQYKIRKRHKVF